MTYKLSEGSLKIILYGGIIDNPVMQVLGINKIICNAGHTEVNLLLFDGKHSQSAYALGTQLYGLINAGLPEYSVVQIDKYITRLMNDPWEGDRRHIFILGITVLASGSEIGQKLGNPQHLDMINSIASLGEGQNGWMIKARVESKSAINTFPRGQWFSMYLSDKSKMIRAVFFKQHSELYNQFELDKEYYIGRCRVQETDPAHTPEPLELVVDGSVNVIVAECPDQQWSGVNATYNFVPIAEIADRATESFIDMIGVCRLVTAAEDVMNTDTQKREIMVVDRSMHEIMLTLWNSEAEDFQEYAENPVVVVKNARVKEFRGAKYVTCLASTMVRLNPLLPETNELRAWFAGLGPSQLNNIFTA